MDSKETIGESDADCIAASSTHEEQPGQVMIEATPPPSLPAPIVASAPTEPRSMATSNLSPNPMEAGAWDETVGSGRSSATSMFAANLSNAAQGDLAPPLDSSDVGIVLDCLHEMMPGTSGIESLALY
eukprot:SAG31_NODE_56_length_29726_cov_41.443312_6_plen_128_part_00